MPRSPAAGRPLIKVPFFTPKLSSYWVALVTPVSLGLIQPLVEGLGAEMLVTQTAAGRHQRRPDGLRRRRPAAL